MNAWQGVARDLLGDAAPDHVAEAAVRLETWRHVAESEHALTIRSGWRNCWSRRPAPWRPEGARLGVNRIAERIVQQVREAYFSPFLRQSFEASTGIDCSDFYDGGVLRAMPTLRKMEAFLDGPRTEDFEDGTRHFFGRPIEWPIPHRGIWTR